MLFSGLLYLYFKFDIQAKTIRSGKSLRYFMKEGSLHCHIKTIVLVMEDFSLASSWNSELCKMPAKQQFGLYGKQQLCFKI